MFLQVIEGKVDDPSAVRRASERWLAELAPGATGWLGTTSGVTADGIGVVVICFDSAESAAANSERPEQSAFFEEASAAFGAGPPTFLEGTDTQTLLGGLVPTARFVQVMRGVCNDRAALEAMEAELTDKLTELHTGLEGAVRVWGDGGAFADVNFFTDEASARAGEQAMGADAELGARLGEWQTLFSDLRYLDLGDPIIATP